MQGIQIQIENAMAVQKALDSFEKKISKKIVRQGVRAAWKPLLDKSKQNARSVVGGMMGSAIARRMQLKAFRRQRRGQYGMLVWIRPQKGQNIGAFGMRARAGKSMDDFVYESPRTGRRAYIPSAIEYGHAFPYHGGRGASKDVAAIPFMRPALDATLPKAPKIFEEHLNRAITEENAKR